MMVIVLGFTALSTSTYLSSNQLDTGTYIRLWIATILILAFGFLIILSGFLMATSGRMKRAAGGIMGVIASFAGAFTTLILVTTTAGITTFGTSPQLSLALEILFVGTIIALFAGFPLSMFGTVSSIVKREPETETSVISG
jgi:hypothetical protein